MPTCSSLFRPHPNLCDAVNCNIAQSEIEGGVFLEDLLPQTVLQIHTRHRCYTAVFLGGSQALISGHPEYCPEPILVAIAGSSWGGSMLKKRFVGRGMHLEFHHPEYCTPIITSTVQEVREVRMTHFPIVFPQLLDSAFLFPPPKRRDSCLAKPDSARYCHAGNAPYRIRRTSMNPE